MNWNFTIKEKSWNKGDFCSLVETECTMVLWLKGQRTGRSGVKVWHAPWSRKVDGRTTLKEIPHTEYTTEGGLQENNKKQYGLH